MFLILSFSMITAFLVAMFAMWVLQEAIKKAGGLKDNDLVKERFDSLKRGQTLPDITSATQIPTQVLKSLWKTGNIYPLVRTGRLKSLAAHFNVTPDYLMGLVPEQGQTIPVEDFSEEERLTMSYIHAGKPFRAPSQKITERITNP